MNREMTSRRGLKASSFSCEKVYGCKQCLVLDETAENRRNMALSIRKKGIVLSVSMQVWTVLSKAPLSFAL